MTSDEPPEEDRQGQAAEDAEAILGRRRFLIVSTLVGAGIGTAMSGCGPYSRPCLKLPPRQPPQPEPMVCLQGPEPSQPPKPEPKVCLKVPAPP